MDITNTAVDATLDSLHHATALAGRDATIRAIRQALKLRSGKAWSVRGGRGTAWGWITIDVPPAVTGDDAFKARRVELMTLLGLPETDAYTSVSVPASTAHYREYIDRANGRPATVTPAYWD